MPIEPEPKTSPTSSAVNQIHVILARFDVQAAQIEDIAEIRGLAGHLIGPGIAAAETLARVHALSGAALFLTRDAGEATGALAVIPLNAPGLAAIEADRFDGVEVDLGHVARRHEPVAGLYVWGVAATSPRSTRQVLGGVRAVIGWAAGRLPCFARAATADGRRLLLGRATFKPMPGSRTGLLVLDRPIVWEQAA